MLGIGNKAHVAGPKAKQKKMSAVALFTLKKSQVVAIEIYRCGGRSCIDADDLLKRKCSVFRFINCN